MIGRRLSEWMRQWDSEGEVLPVGFVIQAENLEAVYEAAQEWERMYDALENPESTQRDAERCYQANLKLQAIVREMKDKS